MWITFCQGPIKFFYLLLIHLVLFKPVCYTYHYATVNQKQKDKKSPQAWFFDQDENP
jgi:hypothetical protein